jgi:hypothetical protein
MRKLLGLSAVLAAVAFPAAAQATGTPTFDPAAAPQGTHVQTGTPSCSFGPGALDVTCSTYELAGVGNTNATATLTVTYTATVVCINNGGKPSDGQHQGTFSASSSTGSLSPENGRLTVPSLSVTAPTEEEFLAQQTCPNPNWTPTIPGGITLSSSVYTLTFEGFTGAYITIVDP